MLPDLTLTDLYPLMVTEQSRLNSLPYCYYFLRRYTVFHKVPLRLVNIVHRHVNGKRYVFSFDF